MTCLITVSFDKTIKEHWPLDTGSRGIQVINIAIVSIDTGSRGVRVINIVIVSIDTGSRGVRVSDIAIVFLHYLACRTVIWIFKI